MASTPQPIIKPDIQYTKLFINNEFVDSVSGTTFPTIDPATGEKIADVQEADKADVDKAVAAAKAAFKRGSTWRNTDPSERQRLMLRLADLIERDCLILSSIETLDAGKPFADVYHGDAPAGHSTLRYYSGVCDKIVGQTIPVDGNFFAYTRMEPVGVVAAITPWNFPMSIMILKMAPALATGCTIVIKPAEQTPLSALHIAALVKEAGFPPGVVNVLPGYGPTAGAALANHPDVNKVSFTGSTEVGKLIMQASGNTNLKRVSLELGGKSPNIIFDDVDLDYAVEQAHQAVMYNMGQVCVAGSRTYVHEAIYDEFIQRSVERARKRTTGNPFDPSFENGPQIDGEQMKKILDLIKSGQEQGAELLCGGSRMGDKGFFIQPTVFANVTADMRIAREEIFGPVQSILKFSDIEEVIEKANDTHYGLAAAVYTKDIDKALTVSNALEAGTVWVNNYGESQVRAPFGGYKMSGIGREMGFPYGIQDHCEIKTVYIKTQGKN